MDYALVRFALLRVLALVYLAAFLIAAFQIVPLVGAHGLEPVEPFLDRARGDGGAFDAFVRLPTLFWLGASDRALLVVSWLGAGLSFAALAGVENALVQLALWVLYLSIAQIGQTFYSFGWEYQLLETGMLAVFLCPARTLRPLAGSPPYVVILLLRWLIVRVMLGAGLIKLRGDPCWRDLTCLVYHYETQPNPSPLSWLFHAMPPWAHRGGALGNFAVELVAPFFAFGPRRARLVAGALFVAFQLTLIASGNLSFLNWLTIVPALACFDDRALRALVPRRFVTKLASHHAEPSRPHVIAAITYAVVVILLSLEPTVNLVSPNQVMNRSYDRLHLVGTYGAFGSVGRERKEIILEGTSDAVVDERTVWLPYELPCKPGDPARRPCLVTPYHYRLAWQIWFAAMSSPGRQPWLVHFVAKLLEGDPGAKSLLAKDPFPDSPPRFVRATLWRYEMTRPGEPLWWRRTYVRPYLPPMSRDDPDLAAFLRTYGWW